MPETQQTQYEERGWFGSLTNWFNDTVVAGTAQVFSNEASNFRTIYTSDHPGQTMMGIIRDGMVREGAPQEQLSQFDTIAGDQRLVGALDKALKDGTVIRALNEATGDNPQDRAAFLASMQNPQNRGLMTRVLERIGESSSDTLDGDELKQVIQQANAQDYVSLNRTLEGMGIQDTRLQMGAMAQAAGIDVGGLANGGVLNAVGSFIDNPEQGISSWLNNPNSIFSELDQNSKAGIASILQMVVKFFGGAMKDFAGDFAALGEHYGPQFVARGNEILSGHNPDASPTRGDGHDVQVADASRPSGAFARAASGYEPPRSAPESVIAAATVEHPELRQQTMSGRAYAM